ncbi:hypothetical protein FC13_GL002172 [Lacticaseibacillus casei DSM 20011 = JCM 1134 = ATCC 393]|nr:hypothetical protein FC13_GL002172 [Lacticaseibacillus casei DSM 20011 = JCM 1134 = ATCC 393]
MHDVAKSAVPTVSDWPEQSLEGDLKHANYFTNHFYPISLVAWLTDTTSAD